MLASHLKAEKRSPPKSVHKLWSAWSYIQYYSNQRKEVLASKKTELGNLKKHKFNKAVLAILGTKMLWWGRKLLWMCSWVLCPL